MTEEKKVETTETKTETVDVAEQAKELGTKAFSFAKAVGSLNIFKFEKMLTPKLMTIFFILCVISSIIGGFAAMSNAYSGVTIGSIFQGLGIMVMGIVFSRVWCELVMVFFRIYECLKVMADKAEEK